MAMTGLLWSFLHADALISGLVWVSIGVIYAVVLTKVTGKRLADLGMDEKTAEPEHALAAEPRTAERVLEEAIPAEPRAAERVLVGV